jgi:copper chaperone
MESNLEGIAPMKTIKIKGMSCQHCVKAVTRALSEIDGIQDVKVDLARGEAAFDEVKPVDPQLLRERIEKAGFELG